METLVKLIGEQAAGQSFTVVLLLGAVYWLNRLNQSGQAASQVERKARMDEMTARMTKTETDISRCEADRHELWKQLLIVQREAITIGRHALDKDTAAFVAAKQATPPPPL